MQKEKNYEYYWLNNCYKTTKNHGME
jgi:hypothetical protein